MQPWSVEIDLDTVQLPKRLLPALIELRIVIVKLLYDIILKHLLLTLPILIILHRQPNLPRLHLHHRPPQPFPTRSSPSHPHPPSTPLLPALLLPQTPKIPRIPQTPKFPARLPAIRSLNRNLLLLLGLELGAMLY